MHRSAGYLLLPSLLTILIGLPAPGWGDFCEPLVPPSGTTLAISSEQQIRYWSANAEPGTTLLIAPGIYEMDGYVHIIPDHITLRGETGRRADVILDFGGMHSGHFGILVDGDDTTIADLTIRNTSDHGVSIQGCDRPMLYNLHIVDTGDQLVKVNPAGDGSDDGVLACSLLEYSTSAPDTYTNGISAHDAHGWTVRDNTWRRIRTIDDNVSVPAILFWSGSTDTVVERNLLLDCSRGIAFGNAGHGVADHRGGIVRNNIIYSRLPHDTAIEMIHADGWLVAHNSVLVQNPLPGLSWGIEARFSDTEGLFRNNLSTMAVWADRDGARGIADPLDNLANAATTWFVDPDGLDFRLSSAGHEAIDTGVPENGVPADFHGQSRDSLPDLGADEWQPSLQDTIAILQLLTSSGPGSELVFDLDGDAVSGLAEVMILLGRMSGVP